MQLVFSDAHYWENFLPLTFTRPVAEMRCGILTFSERWKKLLNTDEISYITEDYLQQKFARPEGKESLFITPNCIPSDRVLEQIKRLQLGEALVYENELLAAKVNVGNFSLDQITTMMDVEGEILLFKQSTDLFSFNDKAIDFDFELLTKGRTSQPLSSTNGFLGNTKDLFI